MANQPFLAEENTFLRVLEYDLCGAKRYDRFTTLMRVTPIGQHPEFLFLLRDVFRKTDRFFVYQENNVIVMLRETDSAGAVTMARRSRDNCTEEIDIRLSLATFPDDGKSPGELLETLDRRFVQAMQSGRGTIVNHG